MKLAISLSAIVPNGVYSAVRPLGLSIGRINALMDVIAFADPSRDDPHVTVLYSRNDNRVTSQPLDMPTTYRASIEKFTSWVGHDGKPYVVALLDSPDLQAAHAAWIELGYTKDFPDYRPHITFKKNLPEDQVANVLTLLNDALNPISPIMLVFGSQRIEPLDD